MQAIAHSGAAKQLKKFGYAREIWSATLQLFERIVAMTRLLMAAGRDAVLAVKEDW